MTIKLVKIIKVHKSTKLNREVEVDAFTYNPTKKKIGYYMDDTFPVLNKDYQHRYHASLQAINDSKNGVYKIETDAYQLTVEISNLDS